MLKKIVLITVGVLCFCGGMFFQSLRSPQVEDLVGYESQEQGDMLRYPMSFSTVEEFRIDEDKNGIFEDWTVTIGVKSPKKKTKKPFDNAVKDPFFLTFTRQDLDETGQVEEVRLKFMEKTMIYECYDDIGDEEIDRQAFLLYDQTSDLGHAYKYMDINLDGRIDLFINKLDKEEGYVIIDDRVFYLLSEKGGNLLKGYFVKDTDENVSKILFNWDKGIWGFEELSQ